MDYYLYFKYRNSVDSNPSFYLTTCLQRSLQRNSLQNRSSKVRTYNECPRLKSRYIKRFCEKIKNTRVCMSQQAETEPLSHRQIIYIVRTLVMSVVVLFLSWAKKSGKSLPNFSNIYKSERSSGKCFL